MIYIPAIYNSIIVKKKKTLLVVLYNTNFTVKLPISTNQIDCVFDTETNSIMYDNMYASCLWSKLVNKFNMLTFTFEAIFFEKIKFSGKGFKITFKKKKKFLHFMFGHSHIKIIFLKNTFIKRLTKYKYIIKSKNKNNLKKTALLISHVRHLNIYTKRGLRIVRQFVFKRKGKKSTYV